jgi:hypothetical protein
MHLQDWFYLDFILYDILTYSSLASCLTAVISFVTWQGLWYVLSAPEKRVSGLWYV